VARAQKAESGGAAGRVAARRRDTSRDGRQPTRAAAAPKKRGGARASDGSALKRSLRLVGLMALMGLIGFFAVLVIDVSASLVGKVSLGDTTMSGLWDKVVDRVLDRDVPRLPDAPRARSERPVVKRPAPRVQAPTAEPVRAPVPAAPLPEEDARHVQQSAPRADPQVEQARKRLDDLLKRL
jgi:hypothetical protein